MKQGKEKGWSESSIEEEREAPFTELLPINKLTRASYFFVDVSMPWLGSP